MKGHEHRGGLHSFAAWSPKSKSVRINTIISFFCSVSSLIEGFVNDKSSNCKTQFFFPQSSAINKVFVFLFFSNLTVC